MEVFDFLFNLSALHYLAMVVVALNVLLLIVTFPLPLTICFAFVVLLSYKDPGFWPFIVCFLPTSVAVLFFWNSMKTVFLEGKRVFHQKNTLYLLLINVVLFLSAIGGWGYSAKVKKEELNELIPICKATDLEAVKKTGKMDEFVAKCENALKVEVKP